MPRCTARILAATIVGLALACSAAAQAHLEPLGELSPETIVPDGADLPLPIVFIPDEDAFIAEVAERHVAGMVPHGPTPGDLTVQEARGLVGVFDTSEQAMARYRFLGLVAWAGRVDGSETGVETVVDDRQVNLTPHRLHGSPFGRDAGVSVRDDDPALARFFLDTAIAGLHEVEISVSGRTETLARLA